MGFCASTSRDHRKGSGGDYERIETVMIPSHAAGAPQSSCNLYAHDLLQPHTLQPHERDKIL